MLAKIFPGAFTSAGTRTRVITKIKPINPVIVRQEIRSDFTRTSEITTRRSGQVTYQSSLTISADQPLTITTSYRAGVWIAKQVSVEDYRSTLEARQNHCSSCLRTFQEEQNVSSPTSDRRIPRRRDNSSKQLDVVSNRVGFLPS